MSYTVPVNQGMYNLAMETSSRVGSVTLGRGDVLLATKVLPPQERHRVDLLPMMDGLCREHGVKPTDIGELYVSHGPGSFTGLRIGITSAKTLALITGAKLVAVPTLDVVAMNVPVQTGVTLIVALNMKKETVYAGVYGASDDGTCWQLTRPAGLTTLTELLATITGPVMMVGTTMPAIQTPLNECHTTCQSNQTNSVPQFEIRNSKFEMQYAQPRSENVWRLGRQLAKQNQFTPTHDLLPLYVRIPEAVELWEKRHGAGR